MPDETPPRAPQVVAPTKPAMVLPPPAPQNELEGLQAGHPKIAEPIPNVNLASGGPTETRIHPDATRHPGNQRWTRSPNRVKI